MTAIEQSINILAMWRKLKRKLFPQKYLLRENARQVARIDKKLTEYQGLLDCLLSASSLAFPDAKDLAYYFHLKRDESRSQFCQDLWVLRELKGKRGGFFVEFGATNGVDLSNSCLLEEKYDWKGILAEPMPTWHAKLARRKAIVDTRCVWSASGKKLTFLCADSPVYSGVQETSFSDGHSPSRMNGQQIQVETISLHDLLVEHRAPKVIDYISIDTEGSEYEILSAFDFSRFQFSLITVEHNATDNRPKIYDLLTRNGYLRVFEEFSRCDDWYVHHSLRAPQAPSCK